MKKNDDEHRLVAERRRKLEELRARGNAYPNDFKRNALAEELHQFFDGHGKEALEKEQVEVAVAGRMMVKRVMGKSSFIKLQDRSGQIQVLLLRDTLQDGVYQEFKSWDVGDIVAATGVLMKTNTNELSVRADSVRILTKSLRPLPEKFHGLSDQETRYRQRYVDLIMNEDTRRVFKVRTRVVEYLRQFLNALGFMEVETPMMQTIPGGAVARPFATHHNALDMQLFLRIAPELFLKRLTVGGFDRVYEINRNFRNEGLSTQHNPEFTMLELYQAYADFEDIMALTETMIRGLATSLFDAEHIVYQGTEYDLAKPFDRMSIEESLLKFNKEFDIEKIRDEDYLRAVCGENNIKLEDSYGAGKLQIELFEKTVEAKLMTPTFVTHYPTEVSPLSRQNDNDPFVADRFELFIAGREIANGFSELNDPEEQARRFQAQAELKSGGDDEAMFYDEDYIRALEYGLPPTGGLGVGIDRLVMFLTDSPSIRDVLLFPHMRPEQGGQPGD